MIRKCHVRFGGGRTEKVPTDDGVPVTEGTSPAAYPT